VDDDIAGKSADSVWQPGSKKQQHTDAEQSAANNQQGLSDLAKRVHRKLFYATA
jgi:hypothetical protein